MSVPANELPSPIADLFACMEVGLEGCPTFEGLPPDEAVLSDLVDVGSPPAGQALLADFAFTRYVVIEGLTYKVTIQRQES